MSDGQFLQQVLQGLALGSAYATVALGFAVTFSVMGVINLAHPGLVALGAYAAVVAYPRTGVVGSVLLAIGVTAVMGLIIERGIIRPTNSKGL